METSPSPLKLLPLRGRNPRLDERYEALVRLLISRGVSERALQAGSPCPDFALPDSDGRIVTRSELLDRGPLVLSFYRGRWCPYCVAEIEALESAAAELRAAGATIAAVTAERGRSALQLKRDKSLSLEILCDADHGLSLAFGLVFQVPLEDRQAYVRSGIAFPEIYGNESWFLSIPATYVIGQDALIRFAYVNPDFRERLDPASVVEVLRSLRIQ